MSSQAPGSEKVWVLDDPRADNAAQAIAIAERLEIGFRRIPLSWNWMADVASLAWRGGSILGVAPPAEGAGGLAPSWSPAAVMDRAAAPRLLISSGNRAASVALWLRERLNCPVVSCMNPGIGSALRAKAYDLAIIADHDQPPPGPHVLPVVGVPHRISPKVLRKGASEWAERLEYLPRPRVALLVGGAREHPFRGSELSPLLAQVIARKVARLTAARGGSVMATTSRRTGAAATEGVAAGLGRVMHLLYRWGEPGENPYLGFLGLADAVVVTADSLAMVSEACATNVPVFVIALELAGPRQRRLAEALARAGQVRSLSRGLTEFPRAPLDEAGRVARELRRRFALG